MGPRPFRQAPGLCREGHCGPRDGDGLRRQRPLLARFRSRQLRRAPRQLPSGPLGLRCALEELRSAPSELRSAIRLLRHAPLELRSAIRPLRHAPPELRCALRVLRCAIPGARDAIRRGCVAIRGGRVSRAARRALAALFRVACEARRAALRPPRDAETVGGAACARGGHDGAPPVFPRALGTIHPREGGRSRRSPGEPLNAIH
jgi:hypothetical protein